MKKFTLRLFFVCSIIMLTANSCGDDSNKQIDRLVHPSENQLVKNSFTKFLEELKSVTVYERQSFVDNFITKNPVSQKIEDKGLACFYWYGTASSVLINGDLQSGWEVPDTLHSVNCGEKNFFYRIYSLPTDARLDYLYIIDGQTLTDPRNPFTTPSGYGLHSQLTMPGFIPDTVRKVLPNVPKGNIEELTFESKLPSFKSRRIKIYIPSCNIC